jgi:hypothetical protein
MTWGNLSRVGWGRNKNEFRGEEYRGWVGTGGYGQVEGDEDKLGRGWESMGLWCMCGSVIPNCTKKRWLKGAEGLF